MLSISDLAVSLKSIAGKPGEANFLNGGDDGLYFFVCNLFSLLFSWIHSFSGINDEEHGLLMWREAAAAAVVV